MLSLSPEASTMQSPLEALMLKCMDTQYIARHTEDVSSCLNLGDLSKTSPVNSPFVQAAPLPPLQ